MDGVLVVDKPAGPTSHDVVSRVRRALRTKRIGHTGTLDPLATGVLPLVIGRATRLASLLSGADKEYDAGVRLGLATETYDAADRVGPPPDPHDGPMPMDYLRKASPDVTAVMPSASRGQASRRRPQDPPRKGKLPTRPRASAVRMAAN